MSKQAYPNSRQLVIGKACLQTQLLVRELISRNHLHSQAKVELA